MISADEKFMCLAIKEAKKAYDENEVPVGAIIVKDDKVIARGHNKRENTNNVLDHAEIIAIKNACKKLGRWILDDCTIYVTSEPCLMCAGAISQSRIKRLVYGVKSPKYGVCESTLDVTQSKKLFHNFSVTKDICTKEIEEMMKSFFKELRK